MDAWATADGEANTSSGGRGAVSGGDTPVKRGTKRDAGDTGLDLTDFERFEKRLRKLNLRNEFTPLATKPLTPATSRSSRARAETSQERMSVDDRPDRIYISDLDAELADDEDEGDEQRLIFLPDIEKKLTRIPKPILTDRSDEDEAQHGNRELVLYSIPGLSSDDGSEGDASGAVRRAIVEARQRAREKALEAARLQEHDATARSHGSLNGLQMTSFLVEDPSTNGNDSDTDAMDIG